MSYANTFAGTGGLQPQVKHFTDQFNAIAAAFAAVEADGGNAVRAAAALTAIPASPAAKSLFGFAYDDSDATLVDASDNEDMKTVPETASKEWYPLIMLNGAGSSYTAGAYRDQEWTQYQDDGTDVIYSDFFSFASSTTVTVTETGMYMILLNVSCEDDSSQDYRVIKGASTVIASTPTNPLVSSNLAQHIAPMVFMTWLTASDTIKIQKYVTNTANGAQFDDFWIMVKLYG